MELRDRNEEHKNLIKDRLDPDFGLLDELLVSRSLTRPEISKVKAIPDSYGRSEAILGYVLDRNISKVKADPESCGRSEEVLGYVLDRNISKVKADPESCGRSEEVLGYVLDRSIYDNFLYALRSTQQTHLANFIFSSGERRAEFGNDWPLTEREISILDTNQRSLVDLLETSDLLPHLYSHEVINNRQRDFVKSKTTSHEKNDALLDILRRTSLHNYYETINCLHLTKQSHIAKVLKEGGAVVRVRSELETESDVNQVEDELITTITELLEDRSLGDSARILECSQLRLIAAKRGSSIILYFVCKSLPDLVHLKEMQTSGKLTNVVREMFNEILSRTQVINLRITVYDEDFSRCEFFLCGIGGKDRFKEGCDEDDAIATSKTAVMSAVKMNSYVRPTSVRLYHRRDAVKKSHPVLQKTATDRPQMAFLVKMDNERLEMQVCVDIPAIDRCSSSTGTGSGPGSPARYGPGPGAQLVAAFDLKTIRSCVFRGNEWIEITDSSGQCIAVEFNKDDPGFLDFNQRLTTNLKLLKVKCSSTPATFDRAKWLPTTTSAARDLPPPPPDSSSARRQLPSREELDQHDYCDLVDDNNDRASTPNDWPTGPPPPPPSTKPRRRGWEIPQGDDRGRSINSSDRESISNSSNTTQYSNRRSLSSNTSREGDYLLPVSHRLPRDANDTVKRTLPPPPPKPGPQMTKDTSGSSSSSTSGLEWHCSKCTYWNSAKHSQCEMCDNPRKVDADQCREYSRVRDFQSKDESSCPECRSVAASKSLDCSECRRLDRKASGCKDVRAASRTKTDDCEECNRVGNRAQVECKACRISAAIKSNSLDGAQHKRLDEARDDECVKCIAVMAILAPENPPPKTPNNTTAHSASSIPDSRCPVAVNVSSLRCRKCTLLNPANAIFCTTCSMIRDDAWQCLVCNAVISSDLYRCETCDVWKCRLCTTQNDARENATRVCKLCSQFQ